jgi:hypothetical protein
VKPALPILAVVAAVAAVWAYSSLQPPPPAPPPTEAAPVVAPRPTDRGQASLADALQVALDPPRAPESERRAQSVARREAEASFDALMESMEGLADRHERLPRARRDQLYRNVNDAFSALSATLDPRSDADMQALEDANIRMKAMLSELGIQVPRRRLEPP